jgi:predicted SAM-dependent methyltransferase
MKYLNLGCGSRFHPDWTNVDFVSTGEGVIAHNLIQGIPFPDESFDVVYHSHLLEHLPKSQAQPFILECYRVLRPQGILRVVVPDLEEIARTYLKALEQASRGSQEWVNNYEWILLEMYDQTVRNLPGGEMAKYLLRESIPNPEFAIARWGQEAKIWIEAAKKLKEQIGTESKSKQLLRSFYRLIRYSSYRRELWLKIILGEDYKLLEIGRFRQGGEIHQWMYDRYSLGLLLKQCSLEGIVKRTASESYINDWSRFNLDTAPDGTVYKPDSLFIEAIKPSK